MEQALNNKFDAFDINSINAARVRLGLKKMTKREYLSWIQRYCKTAGIDAQFEIVHVLQKIVGTPKAFVTYYSAFKVFSYVNNSRKQHVKARVRAAKYDLVVFENPLASYLTQPPVHICMCKKAA